MKKFLKMHVLHKEDTFIMYGYEKEGCKFLNISMKQCRIRRSQLAGIELDEHAENEIYIME